MKQLLIVKSVDNNHVMANIVWEDGKIIQKDMVDSFKNMINDLIEQGIEIWNNIDCSIVDVSSSHFLLELGKYAAKYTFTFEVIVLE